MAALDIVEGLDMLDDEKKGNYNYEELINKLKKDIQKYDQQDNILEPSLFSFYERNNYKNLIIEEPLYITLLKMFLRALFISIIFIFAASRTIYKDNIKVNKKMQELNL